MKKFYRTANGRVLDVMHILAALNNKIIVDEGDAPIDVVKSSDKLTDLIDYGDLIRVHGGLLEVEKGDNYSIDDTIDWLNDKEYKNYRNVTEWYIKRDNDYVLVAKGNPLELL